MFFGLVRDWVDFYQSIYIVLLIKIFLLNTAQGGKLNEESNGSIKIHSQIP